MKGRERERFAGRRKKPVSAVKTALLFSLCFLMLFSAACGEDSHVTEALQPESTEAVSEETLSGEKNTDDKGEEESGSVSSASDETDLTSASSDTDAASENVTEEAYIRSFGHFVDKDIAAANEKTLAEPAAMVYDISVIPSSYPASEVLELIESYELPDTAFYGDSAVTDEIKNAILDSRNLSGLEVTASEGGSVTVTPAILTECADVRSFPVDMKAVKELSDSASDMFQETELPYASGVWILHRTEDSGWCFVIGENYYGWIRTGSLAVCSREEYTSWMNPDHFLVETGFVPGSRTERLGVILPWKDRKGTVYTVLRPVRDADGGFMITEEEIDITSSSVSWSDGFLSWSGEAVIELARSMLGCGYGWSDENGLYDCSSTIGQIYRCFGFYIPRNTSIMCYAGLNVTDVSAMTADEKYRLMEEHKGCILLMKGHALLYEETTEAGHTAIHNTTYQGLNCCVESNLEEMYNASGQNYTDLLTYIIFY